MNNKFSINDIKCRKYSLRIKVLVLLSLALFIFGFAAAAMSYKIYLDSSVEQHKRLAIGIANLVSDVVNPKLVDDYLEKGTSLKEYNETKMKLYKIRESSPDIKYVYVYKILEDGCHVVFDLDTPEVIGNDPGTVQEFDESFKEYLPALLAGKKIDPIITDDTYGWLLTAYVPVRNSEGVTQCYAAVGGGAH